MNRMVAYFYNGNLFAILFHFKCLSFISFLQIFPYQPHIKWKVNIIFRIVFFIQHILALVASCIFHHFPLHVGNFDSYSLCSLVAKTEFNTINAQCLPFNLNLIVIGTWKVIAYSFSRLQLIHSTLFQFGWFEAVEMYAHGVLSIPYTSRTHVHTQYI